MFTCVCGRVAFYSDEMVLLDNNIVEVNGRKELEVIRTIKYYTCINCDKRWIYSVPEGRFVLADGSGF